MAKRKIKKPTITVRRVSDGDTKEILTSAVGKYAKMGYKADWQPVQEVKAEVKDIKKEESKESKKEEK